MPCASCTRRKATFSSSNRCCLARLTINAISFFFVSSSLTARLVFLVFAVRIGVFLPLPRPFFVGADAIGTSMLSSGPPARGVLDGLTGSGEEKPSAEPPPPPRKRFTGKPRSTSLTGSDVAFWKLGRKVKEVRKEVRKEV